MAEIPEVGSKDELTRELMEKMLQHPAPYTNRVFLTIMGMAGRLTFAEQIFGATGAGPIVRCAVSMSITDLLSLKDLLNKSLAHVELTETLESSNETKGDANP